MPALKDLTGQRFGSLLCVSKGQKTGTKVKWNCLCDCRNTVTVAATHLVSGHTVSCGCNRYKKPCLIVGSTHGDLKLIRKHPVDRQYNGENRGHWDVECSCGKKLVVSTAKIRNNKNLNCGSLVHRLGYKTYPKTPQDYPQEAAQILAKYLFLLRKLDLIDSEDIGIEAFMRGAFICYWRRKQGFPIEHEKMYFLKIVQRVKVQAFNKSVKIEVSKFKGRLHQMERDKQTVAQAETQPNSRLPRKKIRFRAC